MYLGQQLPSSSSLESKDACEQNLVKRRLSHIIDIPLIPRTCWYCNTPSLTYSTQTKYTYKLDAGLLSTHLKFSFTALKSTPRLLHAIF